MTGHRNPPPSPLDALWQTPAIVLIVLAGEALALILALAPGPAMQSRLITFGLASLTIQWTALLTLGTAYLLRRPLARLPIPRMVWVMLALLLLATWCVGAAAWLTVAGAADPDAGWPGFLLRISAIALIVGLLGLVVFQNYWHAKQFAVRAKQSELEVLQARIRPHFLFNTLNTGAALIRGRPDAAEKLLLDLADLFRAALTGPREIALSDELALTRRYLDIETLRFGDRLRVEWRLPENMPDVSVPSLSVQPLAENAIRHGIEPLPGGGRVDIAVELDDEWVRVTIGNDMPGAASTLTSGHRIGLNSSHARMQAITDGRGGVETAIADGRFVATLSVPRQVASGM